MTIAMLVRKPVDEVGFWNAFISGNHKCLSNVKRALKRYKMICPLISFQIPWNVYTGPDKLTHDEVTKLFKERNKKVVKGINLVDGVKLRLASKEDFEDLNTVCQGPFGPAKKYSPRTYVFVKHFKGEVDYEVEQVIRNTLLALRLLKDGYVSAGPIFYIVISEHRRLSLTTFDEEESNRDRMLGYALKFNEIPTLRKILRKLQAVDFAERKSLNLACRRFARGYEEKDPEDRLIDFIIAFEALLLKGEKRVPSPGKAIAIACSTLLGKNEEQREQIKRTLTEAYSIRNCVVHGSDLPRTKPDSESEFQMDTLDDFVSEIEDFLRESIKKLLD